METREQFLREYQAQVLDKLVLPPGLREQYSPQACLKDGERQVYLVHDQTGWPAVLKLQPTGREDTLRQEYVLSGTKQGQVFITTCESGSCLALDTMLHKSENGVKLFHVKQGSLL